MKFIYSIILAFISLSGYSQILTESFSIFSELKPELKDTLCFKVGIYSYAGIDPAINKNFLFNDAKIAFRYKPSNWNILKEHLELGFKLRTYFSNYSNVNKEVYQKPFTVMYDLNNKYGSFILTPNFQLVTKYQLIPDKIKLSVNYALRYNYGGSDFLVNKLNKIGHDLSMQLSFDRISINGMWQISDFDKGVLYYRESQNVKFSIPENFYNRLKIGTSYTAPFNSTSYMNWYAYYMGTKYTGAVTFYDTKEEYTTWITGLECYLLKNVLVLEYISEPSRTNRTNQNSLLKRQGLSFLYGRSRYKKLASIGLTCFMEQEVGFDQTSLNNQASNFLWYIHLSFLL